jgi:hypothetical protein
MLLLSGLSSELPTFLLSTVTESTMQLPEWARASCLQRGPLRAMSHVHVPLAVWLLWKSAPWPSCNQVPALTPNDVRALN